MREIPASFFKQVELTLEDYPAFSSGVAPTWRHAYRHFRAFATSILDKLDIPAEKFGDSSGMLQI